MERSGTGGSSGCHMGTIDENEEFRHKYDWNSHFLAFEPESVHGLKNFAD
jgi:hypothetical protein